MKIRIVTALLALALPLAAQEAPSAQAENLFYKAFWLEKGARDYSGAMELYQKFLVTAPEHKLAATAARQQFSLLDRTGRTAESAAFREKYKALLADVPAADAPADRPAGDARRGPPAGGEAGDAPRGRGAAGRPDMQTRIAELEKELAKAKEAGDEQQIARLTRQLERMKQFAERGAGGAGAEGGRAPGGRRGGMFGAKPLAEMNEEEMTQFKAGLERFSGMIDGMRERVGEEQAKAMEANLQGLKKALDAGKLEEAQKALDKFREAFPRRTGRGGRGGAGGAGGGGAGGVGGGGRGGGGGGGR